MKLPRMMISDREKKTFCSKHVTEVLQTAGVRAVVDMRAAEMTPSALHRALQGSTVFHADSSVVAGLRIEGSQKVLKK